MAADANHISMQDTPQSTTQCINSQCIKCIVYLRNAVIKVAQHPGMLLDDDPTYRRLHIAIISMLHQRIIPAAQSCSHCCNHPLLREYARELLHYPTHVITQSGVYEC